MPIKIRRAPDFSNFLTSNHKTLTIWYKTNNANMTQQGATIDARLYLCGWAQTVTSEEVKKRLDGFPGIVKVKNVILNSKRFAHVEVELQTTVDDIVARLKNTYKNSKWKGGVLQFEPSKPDYLVRLREELERRQNAGQPVTPISEEDAGRLRIRGAGKDIKRVKLIVFTDDDAEDAVDKDVAAHTSVRRSLASMASSKVLDAQDPAYCCSNGDAGPNNLLDAHKSQTLENKNGEVDEANTDLQEPSDLSKFVVSISFLRPKPKRNGPNTLLGKWFAQREQ